ncbi:uncharacterized protein LOC126456522 [Schistocerca serialis cubense]|uniref:uncharacterized protein LOC126456522 n=1 Tax=Schistocerca serialis cubense TaxID=2023355 RepID=UPI00214F5A28|nr:uncharacterized protein LOC126456522 [Schistocerca serialis cubense]
MCASAVSSAGALRRHTEAAPQSRVLAPGAQFRCAAGVVWTERPPALQTVKRPTLPPTSPSRLAGRHTGWPSEQAMGARMESFCCCCSLKSGCVIVAIVYVLLGSLMVILGAGPLVLDALPEDEAFSIYKYQARESSVYDWVPCMSGNISKNDLIMLSSITLTTVGALLVIFNIVLILGSCNERRAALLCWLVVDYCWLAVVLVAHSGAATLAFLSSCSGTGFVIAVVAIPALSAITYCHLVVDGFAQQLRERRRSRLAAVNCEKSWD